MIGINQRPGCIIVSNSNKKSDHGLVVSDIPPKFDMLLSRSWAAKLKGTLQMDMSYATIPIFGQ